MTMGMKECFSANEALRRIKRYTGIQIMPLPTLVKQLVEEKLSKYCKDRAPEAILDKVRMTFKTQGDNVTLLEQRPAFLSPERGSISTLRSLDMTTRIMSGLSIALIETQSGICILISTPMRILMSYCKKLTKIQQGFSADKNDWRNRPSRFLGHIIQD